MTTIEIYDPPMCCSTGVCGPTVDPALPKFAADIEWLRGRGVEVSRYNLTQDPDAYTRSSLVLEALQRLGTDCLPLIVVEDHIVSQGTYPSRGDLAALAGLQSEEQAHSSTMETLFDALQEGKLVLTVFLAGSADEREDALKGVREFQQEPRFASATCVIERELSDAAEHDALAELGVAPGANAPVTLLLAPPNMLIGRFDGPTSKEQILAVIDAASSKCQPGSGCCG